MVRNKFALKDNLRLVLIKIYINQLQLISFASLSLIKKFITSPNIVSGLSSSAGSSWRLFSSMPADTKQPFRPFNGAQVTFSEVSTFCSLCSFPFYFCFNKRIQKLIDFNNWSTLSDVYERLLPSTETREQSNSYLKDFFSEKYI